MLLDIESGYVSISGVPDDDGFDPRFWDLKPAQPARLCLSDRFIVECLLDPEDHAWALGPDPLAPQKWCHTYGSGDIDPETGVIARPDHVYARRCVGGKTIFLHREICTRAYGPPPPFHDIADHLNGNTLDNRRCNLRWATRSMNRKNVRGSATRAAFVQQQTKYGWSRCLSA